MKLACVGPLSPSRTGVARFSENLLPFLAKRCEIKLFTEENPPASTPILSEFSAAPIAALTAEASTFDAILYHMGNHYRFHRRVFEALAEVPGIVLFHDCVLNQFFAKYALERGNFGVFRRLFELCYADSGQSDASLFIEGKSDPYRFPMAGAVAMRSRGTIVMSDYGRDIIRGEAAGVEVLKINFPHFESGGESEPAESAEPTETFRRRFGVAEGCFVVTCIGHMTPAKRVDVALEAFRKFSEKAPNSVFLLAGDESPRLSISDMIARSRLKNARYLGYLERTDLDGLMRLSDVCVNLRYPSNGEMSATLLDMLGRGKVTAVSDYAQFAEFPDGTCVKIGLGPGEVDALAGELLDLSRDEERRLSIGKAARERIEREHRPGDAADAIIDFAQAQSGAEPVLTLEDIRGLLLPDGPVRRMGQMIAYNGRRAAAYCRERGVVRTTRQAVRRAFVRMA